MQRVQRTCGVCARPPSLAAARGEPGRERPAGLPAGRSQQPPGETRHAPHAAQKAHKSHRRARAWAQGHAHAPAHACAHARVCGLVTSGGAFSIGCLHTTHIGLGPRSTRIEHSVHMARCPHGTSKAERGSSRQTAHGSFSSPSSPASPASPSRLSGCADDEEEPTGTCSPAEPTGPEGEPTGELAELWSGEQQPGEPAPSEFFLRKPRLLRPRARVERGGEGEGEGEGEGWGGGEGERGCWHQGGGEGEAGPGHERLERLGAAQHLARLVGGDLLERQLAPVAVVVEERLEEEPLEQPLSA